MYGYIKFEFLDEEWQPRSFSSYKKILNEQPEINLEALETEWLLIKYFFFYTYYSVVVLNVLLVSLNYRMLFGGLYRIV